MAIGFVQYKLYFPLHEASHRVLFARSRANEFAGWLLAGLLFTSFSAFRHEHMVHHRYFGTVRDPGAGDYLVPLKTRVQLVRFLSTPLVGGTVITKLHNLLRHQAAFGDSRRGLVRHLLPATLCQPIILAIVTIPSYEPWRYPILVVLPFITIFLCLSRLRMFLEHGTLVLNSTGEYNHPLARTFEESGWDSWLLSGCNFRFHHEHHARPLVSGRELPRLHAQDPGIPRAEIASSYRSALGELWRALA